MPPGVVPGASSCLGTAVRTLVAMCDESDPVSRNPYHDPRCTCPHGIRPLGRLYGIDMGRLCSRLDTDFRCPIHGGQDLRRAARRR